MGNTFRQKVFQTARDGAEMKAAASRLFYIKRLSDPDLDLQPVNWIRAAGQSHVDHPGATGGLSARAFGSPQHKTLAASCQCHPKATRRWPYVQM